MGTQLVPEVLILDSWPLLEWIKGREPAHTRFIALAQEAITGRVVFHMSRMNYGEAVYSIRKAPDIADFATALAKLHAAPISVHTVDDLMVDQAVELKFRYPFAYADAFAAALAIRLRAPLVTGDHEFRKLEADGLLELRWVGA